MTVGDTCWLNSKGYKVIAEYQDNEGGSVFMGLEDTDTSVAVWNLDKSYLPLNPVYFEDKDVSVRFVEASHCFQTQVREKQIAYWRIVVFG